MPRRICRKSMLMGLPSTSTPWAWRLSMTAVSSSGMKLVKLS